MDLDFWDDFTLEEIESLIEYIEDDEEQQQDINENNDNGDDDDV